MSDEHIDKLKQLKKNCKTRLTKFKSFLEKYVNLQNKESVTIKEFETRKEKVEESWNELDRVQTELELLAPSQNLEAESVEFEEFYYRYFSLANQFLNQRKPQASVTRI